MGATNLKKLPTDVAEKKLVNLVSEIVTDENGNLDFEETVYLMANYAFENLNQMMFFGEEFADVQDCYVYILDNFTGLREILEEKNQQ